MIKNFFRLTSPLSKRLTQGTQADLSNWDNLVCTNFPNITTCFAYDAIKNPLQPLLIEEGVEGDRGGSLFRERLFPLYLPPITLQPTQLEVSEQDESDLWFPLVPTSLLKSAGGTSFFEGFTPKAFSTNLSPKLLRLNYYDLPLSRGSLPPFSINAAKATPLLYRGMIEALESVVGSKVTLRVNVFLRQQLTPFELGRILSWRGRLLNFGRIFGRSLFLTDSVIAFYLFLKLRDMPMFMRWLRRAFLKVSFWRYRSFLYFLRYSFRSILLPTCGDLGVVGLRFRLKGKISVAGNARTRTIEHTMGAVKFTSKEYSVFHEIVTIPTFTGVLGLQVWICTKSSMIRTSPYPHV